jgi:hypothetical protein
VNFISLPQEVRGIFVIKAAVEMQIICHFVTNGGHLLVFSGKIGHFLENGEI